MTTTSFIDDVVLTPSDTQSLLRPPILGWSTRSCVSTRCAEHREPFTPVDHREQPCAPL